MARRRDGDSGPRVKATLVELVFPSFLPGEVLLDEVFQANAAAVVIQPPPGGDMPDDQHPLPLPAQRQVIDELTGPPT